MEALTQTLQFELAEDEADHELKFVMKNKTRDHTTINEHGEILTDARLSIADVKFDDLSLDQIFNNEAVYYHNFNGSRDAIEDKFFGEMGCNGTLSLKFSTPIYLWMLEHL